MRGWIVLGLLILGPWGVPLWSQTASGTAGLYAPESAGRATASGEAYDPGALTAAVDNLRFGIRLAVTNPANGRTVTVRVNDSGPGPGRLLDLSQAAAEALAITGPTKVRIRVLLAEEKDITQLPETPTEAAPAQAPGPSASQPAPAARTFVPTPVPDTYFQLGAFRTESNARSLAKSLVAQGYAPQIRKDGSLFRVYLTVPEDQAVALADRLTRAGRNGFLQGSKEPGGTLLKVTTE